MENQVFLIIDLLYLLSRESKTIPKFGDFSEMKYRKNITKETSRQDLLTA